MPSLKKITEDEKIKAFLMLTKDDDEMKSFFNYYQEIMVNSEILCIEFFNNLAKSVKSDESVLSSKDSKNKKFFFKKNKINDELLMSRKQSKIDMLQDIHNILLELRNSAPKREVERSIYISILSLYFDDDKINGKTLIFNEYKQWAAKFIAFSNIEMKKLQGLELRNIKLVTDIVRTLFEDVYRDRVFQRRHCLKLESKNLELKIKEVTFSNFFDDALLIIDSEVFAVYMRQLPIFAKKIPEYIKEIAIIERYDVLVEYQLFHLKRDEIKATIDIIENEAKILIEKIEQYKNKIKGKENNNNIFKLKRMEQQLIDTNETIRTIKLVEECKNAKLIFAIWAIWNRILVLYLKENNGNKVIKIEEFQRWINLFINSCKKQNVCVETNSDKFERINTFIEILENFKKSIIINKEFQEIEEITMIRQADFAESISSINDSSNEEIKQQSRSVFYI